MHSVLFRLHKIYQWWFHFINIIYSCHNAGLVNTIWVFGFISWNVNILIVLLFTISILCLFKVFILLVGFNSELDPGLEEAISTIIWVTPRMAADVQELREACKAWWFYGYFWKLINTYYAHSFFISYFNLLTLIWTCETNFNKDANYRVTWHQKAKSYHAFAQSAYYIENNFKNLNINLMKKWIITYFYNVNSEKGAWRVIISTLVIISSLW